MKLWNNFRYRNYLKIKFVKSVHNDVVTNILVVNEKMFKVGSNEYSNSELNAYRYLLHKFNVLLTEKIVFEEHTIHKINQFN